ncbi:MAG TPA: arylesterase [Sphingomicrobium sp.]|nr:arylesterase [Sphingomicrobium sp.]
MARLLRRYGGLLVALQLALAGCSSETSAPPVEPKPQTEAAPAASPANEKLVLAFGDSLYAGYGLGPGESFPAVLDKELEAQGLAVDMVNAGVSGDTTAAGLARLDFTLDGLKRTPDLAIVGLGGNDVLRGIDPAETRANLEAIVRNLDRRGIPVVLTGMVAPRNLGPDYAGRFDAIYPDLARSYGAALDPFFLDGVITDPKLLLGDGIHPNAAGVRVMARRLAPLVAKELKPVS